MLSMDTRSSVTSYLINIPIGCNIFNRSEVDRTIEKICNRLFQDPFFKSNTHFRLVIGLNQSNRDFMSASCCGDKDRYVTRMLAIECLSLRVCLVSQEPIRFLALRSDGYSGAA